MKNYAYYAKKLDELYASTESPADFCNQSFDLLQQAANVPDSVLPPRDFGKLLYFRESLLHLGSWDA